MLCGSSCSDYESDRGRVLEFNLCPLSVDFLISSALPAIGTYYSVAVNLAICKKLASNKAKFSFFLLLLTVLILCEILKLLMTSSGLRSC